MKTKRKAAPTHPDGEAVQELSAGGHWFSAPQLLTVPYLPVSIAVDYSEWAFYSGEGDHAAPNIAARSGRNAATVITACGVCFAEAAASAFAMRGDGLRCSPASWSKYATVVPAALATLARCSGVVALTQVFTFMGGNLSVSLR